MLKEMLAKKYPYAPNKTGDEFWLGDPVILPMSVNKFFDNFLVDRAPFGLSEFNRGVQEEIKETDLKADKDEAGNEVLTR